jgi:hypothetical protein
MIIQKKLYCFYLLSVIFISFLFLAGCGTKTAVKLDIKPASGEDFLKYSNKEYGISLDYPSNWEKTQKIPLNDDIDFYLLFKTNNVQVTVHRYQLQPRHGSGTIEDLVDNSIEELSLFSGFDLLESTPLTLSNRNAHKFIYIISKNEYYSKNILIQWINQGNIYEFKFKAIGQDDSIPDYDQNLETIQRMIDSIIIS